MCTLLHSFHINNNKCGISLVFRPQPLRWLAKASTQYYMHTIFRPPAAFYGYLIKVVIALLLMEKIRTPLFFFFFKNFRNSNPPPSFSNYALSGKNFHLILIRIFLVNFDILAACQKSEILFRRTCIVLSCGQLRRMISSEFWNL